MIINSPAAVKGLIYISYFTNTLNSGKFLGKITKQTLLPGDRGLRLVGVRLTANLGTVGFLTSFNV